MNCYNLFNRIKTRPILIYLFVLILIILIFIFRNNIKTLSIIFVTTSGLSVIIALIYEGELKAKMKEKKLLNLTGIGLFLLSLFVLSTLGNGIISYKNIKESETKSIKDSIQIKDLKAEIKRIDTTLVQNTLKELEEQRKIKERENENTFIHLQKEVKENLNKILNAFDEKNVRGYTDSVAMFIHSRLSDTYLEKYGTISSNPLIIEAFMKMSAILKKINDYSDILVQQTNKKERKLTVNMIVKNTEIACDYLMNLFERIYNLHSYKEYESLNYSIAPVEFDREKLKQILNSEFENESVEIEKDIDFTKAVIKK